ncbi:MAG: hypothetical protein LBR93_11625 [Treponema sp.]|jgi:hypothetical protein|nr:hypothetical protein [Treponema sp.]
MFTSVSLRKKNPAAKAVLFLFYSLFFALLLFPVLGCQTEADDDDPGIGLNPGLIGTWTLYAYSTTDVYAITPTRLSHHSYSTYPDPNLSGPIVFVYNFDAASGCLIVQRATDEKYTAVYYKDLDEDSVVLGDAYTVSDFNIDVTVPTLAEAITKFAPENKSLYGGDLSVAGTMQRIDR